jgi:hypothetical protein
MAPKKLLEWMPDLRLPAGPRATLQESISHDQQATLRIILHLDQGAEVEVNDRIVAKTTGFQRATALAELYTRDRGVLLTPRSERGDAEPDAYYLVKPAAGRYEARMARDPITLVTEPESSDPLAVSVSLSETIGSISATAKRPLVPAFSDQAEIYEGLAHSGADGLAMAVWISRWQIAFVPILEEDELSPLSLTVSKASDGTYYTIYRLVTRDYLTELRSRHEAEKIGSFPSAQMARAYCNLFNAARHSTHWLDFSSISSKKLQALHGAYLLRKDDHGVFLHAGDAEGELLGLFASTRLAEAYATVHRDAMEHFSLIATD